MPNSKNIIYPATSKGAKFSNKNPALIIAVVVIVLLAAAFFIKKPSSSQPQGIPLQAGYFTISYNPANVTLKAGSEDSAAVRIMVVPLEGFNDRVIFVIENLLFEGVEVKGGDSLTLGISLPVLDPKDFKTGTMLTIDARPKTPKGNYTVVYKANSSSVVKEFTIPVTVE